MNFELISLMSFVLTAQEAPAAQSESFMSPLVAILLMAAVFFLLVIWPQSRRAKKEAQFIASLQKGDDVITKGGLFGKIVGVADRVITLEIAPNVKIRIDRGSIAAKDAGTGPDATKPGSDSKGIAA